MAGVADVLARYRELCDFCDAKAKRVETTFGDAWCCRSGCAGCCSLETVCGLEALVLWRAGRAAVSSPFTRDVGRCSILQDDRCLVYESRPLICRTHGLPLFSGELTGGEVDCCPLNLPALEAAGELETDLVVDLDLITENLLRLNLALFIMLGRPELAETRYPLARLFGDGEPLPPELLAAVRELDEDHG